MLIATPPLQDQVQKGRAFKREQASCEARYGRAMSQAEVEAFEVSELGAALM